MLISLPLFCGLSTGQCSAPPSLQPVSSSLVPSNLCPGTTLLTTPAHQLSSLSDVLAKGSVCVVLCLWRVCVGLAQGGWPSPLVEDDEVGALEFVTDRLLLGAK